MALDIVHGVFMAVSIAESNCMDRQHQDADGQGQVSSQPAWMGCEVWCFQNLNVLHFSGMSWMHGMLTATGGRCIPGRRGTRIAQGCGVCSPTLWVSAHGWSCPLGLRGEASIVSMLTSRCGMRVSSRRERRRGISRIRRHRRRTDGGINPTNGIIAETGSVLASGTA